MKSFFSRYGLAALLVLFALVTSTSVFYEYGLNTAGDELSLLSATLRMISGHTLRPAYPTFYHLAFATYLYLPFVALALAGVLVLGLVPTVAALKQFVILDYVQLLPVVRVVTVGVSLLSLYLTYLIAERLFKNRSISLLATAFTATSLTFGYASHFARIWPIQILTVLVAFYCIVRLYEEGSRKRYALTGLTVGIAAGTHLIGALVYVSFLAAQMVRKGRRWFSDRNFWIANGIILLLLALTVYLNPYSFLHYTASIAPSLLSAIPGASVEQAAVDAYDLHYSPLYRLTFYGRTLAAYDPVLLVFGLLGLYALYRKEKRIAWLLGSFVLVYYVGISFFGSVPRYIAPVIPFLAIAGAFGLHEIIAAKPVVKKVAWLLFVFFVPAVGTLLMSLWFLVPSPRLEATQWIYAHLPAGERIVSFDTFLNLNENKETLGDMKAYTENFNTKRTYLYSLNPSQYPAPDYYLLIVPQYGVIPPQVAHKQYRYALLSSWNKTDQEAELAQLRQIMGNRTLTLIEQFPPDPNALSKVENLANDIPDPLSYLLDSGEHGPVMSLYAIAP